MLRTILLIIAPLLCVCPAWAATQVDGLYVGEAIVTGREADAEHDRGLREALSDVVIKLSGDSRLASHPDLPKLLDQAPQMVASLSYLDRLAKKKLMDEQGTRQRSYLMTVEFQHPAVDRMLGTLGVHAWAAERPTVLVLLAVQDLKGAFALSAEGERGWGQREALADIARRRGLPVVLPRMTPEDQATLSQNGVAALKQAYHADAVLMGSMMMRPDGTWDTGWTLLRDPGLPEVFNVDDTTFDRAIQAGVERTARALAGYD